MKIAFVTNSDTSDIHPWSGTIHHMFKTLQRTGLDVVPIDNLFELSKRNPYFYVKKRVYQHLFHWNYLSARAPAVFKFYARQIEWRIRNLKVDLIVSPNTGLVAHLNVPTPIVIWNDATFASLAGYHPFLRGLCPETLRDGNHAEQMAFDKARLLIFSSQWAARSAQKDYQVNPAKTAVVPFGANLECGRTPEIILADAKNKSRETCRLLFVGTYWESKGGSIALQAAQRMRERGLKAELHVVGCVPPPRSPDWVKTHGFISKSSPEGLQKMDSLFRTSHFLVVPTRAEAFGLVFSEACSYGLPSAGTDTGGVSEIIKNGVNGMLFAPEAPPEAYADWLEEMWRSEGKYLKLAAQSFREYQNRLNWAKAGAEVKRLLMEIPTGSARPGPTERRP